MTANRYFDSRMDFLAFSLFLFVSIALATIAYAFGGEDFGVYYAAGKVFLQGGNPYDYSQLAKEIVSSTGDMNNPYYYVPWFTWALSLFALFPYAIARILWAVINYGLWLWCLYNLTKLIQWNSSGWQKWSVYLYLTFLFAWATWGSEQVGIVIFFIVTFILLSFENKKYISMGLWMAVLLFKPNITAIPLIILAAWLAWRHHWKPILSAFVFLVLMIGASLLVSPGWYTELLQPDKLTGLSYTLNESGETQIERYTTTMLDWLSAYQITGYWAYGIYMMVLVVSIFLILQLMNTSRSLVQVMAAGILINFALVPYALFYDYPSLSLTLCYVNSDFATKPKWVWVQRSMNIFILMCLFIGNDIRHRYWMIVILFVFSMWSGALKGVNANSAATDP